MKQDRIVLYKVCVFRADRKNKMATSASDWLKNELPDITKDLKTYQTILSFCRNLNMFIKKKLKYFTRPKQISPDLSGVSGDFRIV